MESFDESIGFATAQTHRMMFRAFTSYLRSFAITPEQWTVIKRLYTYGDLTQKQLVIAAEKDKATLTRIIDLLEQKTLIKKRLNDEDKRSHYICLTEHGSQLYKAVQPGTEQFYKGLVKDISTTDLANYMDTLQKLQEACRYHID
ncbi:MarR family winged helix-turn-helix transcriptional regulator [Shouchella lehensis]|uniref:MarR family transcriptional regulator n=1 Tax=Shouchella lehensis TaxID=300825 RepID=A0A4Y7WFJ8_9BACI|nr:MarR family transcriptional regulator [Shouchella lehensis]MBG9785094.1 hypothetical protein [Shouchella lehensis]TES46528.1 MarR family transcriptional regulator [Shouchella lehensis]